MLFGRVTDLNVRGNLRKPPITAQQEDPFGNDDFVALDRLVSKDFLKHLPAGYKASHGLCYCSDGSLDTDLYLVHVIPHACVQTF